MAQGIHLPTSIYSYLDENFFNWICNKPLNYITTSLSYEPNFSSSYQPLEECKCNGSDYYSMPTIHLQTESGADENLFYLFNPKQFELFPKVN